MAAVGDSLLPAFVGEWLRVAVLPVWMVGPHPTLTDMTKFPAILVGGLALVFGGIFGMMLSGYGICAARLSVSSVGGALVAAVVLSWLGAVALRTRWLAAILFSLPMVLGFLLAAAAQRWGRCGAIFPCIVASFAVVAMFRVDHRKHGQ